MIKYDCFGYNELTKGCSALRERNCQDCNFYKTKEQAHEDQRKAVKRLKDLGYVVIDGALEINGKKYPARGF